MAYTDIKSSISRCLLNSNISSGWSRRALKTLNLVRSSSGVGGDEEGNRTTGARSWVKGGVERYGTRVGDLLARRL